MKLNLKHRLTLGLFCVYTLVFIPVGFNTELNITELIVLYLVSIVALWICAHWCLKDLLQGINAIETGLLNLKDGEFSTSLAYQKEDEFGALCQLYNETSDKLRHEKQWLYQRELLLDKIVETTPQVLLLVNASGQIIFSNNSAKRFFDQRESIEGKHLQHLIDSVSETAALALKDARDGLFTLSSEKEESQTWHLSTAKFNLHNQQHMLYVLKQLTRELSRQEVAVWKKVIRVISHELNNSLAPISSMLHSGQLLTEHLGDQRLQRVFETIDERIQHLNVFVQGYGKFAKLPEPNLQTNQLSQLCASLQQQWCFKASFDEQQMIYADEVQLEQLLINLLKNAHESGSNLSDIALDCYEQANCTVIEVCDRGNGMSEDVMSNALIPFYSTKTSGSGLGLALCREICDAHGGKIVLQNRRSGGVKVKVILPQKR